MIPVNEPAFGDREFELVTQCLKSGWVSSGEFVPEFEQGWAEYCGRSYGISVSNGTVALQLAVAALGLERGSEVILPTFTIVSCALAVLYNGLKPVLVDSDPETWCMDVAGVKEKLSESTAAIMPVHIYGHPVDIDPILDLADKRSLAVIEDAAEAHGAEYCSKRGEPDEEWKRCGSFGDVSCFSFYGNKLITTGEGGMLLVDDQDLADQARSLRNLAFGRTKRFLHEAMGFNFRLTNLQAALGVAQLERMDSIVARKKEIGRRYTSALRDLKALQLPVEKNWARNVWWMYGVVVREETEFDGTKFAQTLSKRGIDTRPFFLGMHEQPFWREMGLSQEEEFPVAERLARQGIYLPSGLALSDSQIDEVCEAIHGILD